MRIKSLISDVSASTVARVMTLGINSVYFFLIAAWLPKTELGIFVFCLATSQLAAQVLTFGSSQIMVRRIAGQASSINVVAGSALFQRIAFPVFFALAVWTIIHTWSLNLEYYSLLAFAFLAASAGQFSGSLRQVLIAEQKFWWSTFTEEFGLILKVIVGLILVRSGYGAFGLFVALLIGGIGGGLLGFFIIRRILGFWLLPRWCRAELWSLLKEGLPLFGSLLFSRALARVDWILMGIIRTKSETGEYAFAYRLYEFSWLPHAILSTLLLPKLSKALRGQEVSLVHREKINSLHRVMVVVSAILPLIMVLCWTPVIDALTDGKFGAINQGVIMALAVSVPFAAGTGMMWNLAIALKRTKMIMATSCFSSVLNIGLNIVLIPRFGGIGAAVSTIIPMIIQYFVYLYFLRSSLFVFSALTGLICTVISSILAFLTAVRVVSWWPLQVFVGLVVFVVMAYLSGAVRKQDLYTILALKD